MIEQLPVGREDMPAISWFTRKGEEQGVTLARFREDVRCLQTVLVDRKLNGKQIAIIGENSYEWLVTFFACVYCGATAVCVDVEQSDDAIRQMIEMTDISALFCSSSMKDICDTIETAFEHHYLLSGKGGVPSVANLIEIGADIRATSTESYEVEVKPEDIASIVFTSGTTSYAKPVMLSQSAILTNASDALANVAIGEVAFTSLPFYHTYGMTCSVLSMLIGKAHLYINGNLKTVMRDIQLAGPHTMLTVPLILETIHSKMWAAAKEKGLEKKLAFLFGSKRLAYKLGIKNCGKTLDNLRESCFGKIRLVICGGAHMNSEIMRTFQYMGVQVLQGYGITECAPLVSVNRNKANKFDSVGVVSPNTEVKIEDGEILVRGKNVMSGYYNMPELTAEAMRGEWFATGDVGYLDKDNYLYITGRKKNLIVFKNGKKLSPEKLEELIKEIPLVQDVVVYGAISGISTDDVQVATSIYPNKEKCAGMMQYEILGAIQNEINRINKDLPLYQQIQMVNIREQEFNKTALQKIKRHLV
jgi:long-chain acyl-CoA synthetase